MNLVALSNRYKEAISRLEEAIAEAFNELCSAIFYGPPGIMKIGHRL